MSFNFKKNTPSIGKVEKPAVIQNPYVGEAGRNEWNDRYGLMAHHTRLWQGAFGFAMVAVIALTVGIVKVSSESKIQAYAVETSQGEPVTIHPMQAMGSEAVSETALIHYAINNFIIDSRTVVSDTEAQKRLLNTAYAYATDKARIFLNGYFRQNSPFEQVAQNTVSVNIVNFLPLSPHTAQLTWDEVKRSSLNGEVMGKSRWIANITYRRGDVNPKHVMENPFGIYITDVSWSENQIVGEK
jgi:type IV secretion system protein TrbF